ERIVCFVLALRAVWTEQLVLAHATLLRLDRPTVRGSHLRKPCATGLGDALLGWIVRVHHAEALCVAVRPLEIVHERPDEVALQRDALREGGARRQEVLAQVTEARRVVDLATLVHLIWIGRAVLGDVDPKRLVALMEAPQHSGEPR